ncbi:hypothetical protein [Brevundimonas sp. PAMC22021]|uniref:hypothetical protein n=1 Tax=Brevundimonas sp. PAMC22021 TaxID=2861285 RepID=UPI001C635CA1|nr:hypothetical protein [Brevundimonas sp. PAMC22021]QYF86958.1 hypothetical protein KY493_00030 [Brevundimonas sp. PAMC22021]
MNAPAPAPTEPLAFVDAVARRSKVDVGEVTAILTRHGVVATPSPPPARHLRVKAIAFDGTKSIQGATKDFKFEWDVDDGGLYGIVSADNFAGKTTLIQVVLWALRGTPKKLADTSKAWIRNVDVSFLADRRTIRVVFACDEAGVRGQVCVGAGEEQQAHGFDDEEQFKRVMQEVMLEALGLEPIPTSRQLRDGRTIPYEDGWAAYTGAFLADADSDAIIGEHVGGTDLTQRLLQVFIGLPWARTLFQARARLNVLTSDAQQRKRKLSVLGGKSLTEVEDELQKVQQEIADEGLRDAAIAQLLEAQRIYDDLAVRVRAGRDEANAANDAAQEAQGWRINAERALLALEEENAAAAFFGRLSPKCCPRCAASIPKSRVEQESRDRSCSVCKEVAPEPDANAVDAEVRLAKQRVADVKALEADAKRFATKLAATQHTLRAQFLEAGKVLQALSVRGTAADLRNLEFRRERLEGMLEVARAVLNADLSDTDELAVLTGAKEEAEQRIAATAAAVLARANAEVTRIVQRLGMTDVESVSIKRNANVALRKGGADATFGGLSPGEQLRLRIATVVALVRSAAEHQTGRHPGLLLIDSPKREEVADSNLADMLEELKALAKETPGLQMFVALSDKASVFGDLSPSRVLVAGPGEKLW